jgi:hypothetical protein
MREYTDIGTLALLSLQRLPDVLCGVKIMLRRVDIHAG